MNDLFKTCGPEIVAIIEAVEAMARKIKEGIALPEPAPTEDYLSKVLLTAIGDAANANRPHTHHGQLTGLYGRRGELPAAFHKLSKVRIGAMAKDLLDHGEIIKCRAWGEGVAKWLDVPGGPFASGAGRVNHPVWRKKGEK